MITDTYDTKNNPYKNIRGFNKIAFILEYEIGQGNHNIITEVNRNPDFPQYNRTLLIQYTYNSKNYLETQDY